MRRLGWVTRERRVGWRRAPSVLDWLITLALVIDAFIEVQSGVLPGTGQVAAAVQLASLLPVAFRRMAPLPAIAIASAVYLPYTVAYGAYTAPNSLAQLLAALLFIYAVGRHAELRELVAGVAIGLLGFVVEGIRGTLSSPADWAFAFIFFGAALGVGVALRVQANRSIALAEAADHAQREQEAAAQAAVHEERARIARELHDVVADKVVLIVLQAGGARSVLGTDPDRARTALRQIEETGRQTLAEMRHLVGILRVDEGTDPQPLPRLERLPALVNAAGGRHAPSVLDWLVALALVIVAFLETAGGVFPGPVAVVAAVQLAATLPVAFRRVAPLPAIAISAAVFLPYVVVYGTGNSVANGATMLLLAYSVGRHTSRRGLLVGAAFGLLLLAEELAGSGLLLSLGDWAYLLIVFGGALGLGVALRVEVQRSIALAVAAERARSEQEATAQVAVREERARIARELHDVVADKVGLIVLQAGGARSVLATDPERAREALQQVEEMGRQTLAEMRHLVGILREDEDEERQPLPRLERLPALVDEARAGGLTVDLQIEGRMAELPAGLELAGSSAIRPSITNVRKHAPT